MRNAQGQLVALATTPYPYPDPLGILPDQAHFQIFSDNMNLFTSPTVGGLDGDDNDYYLIVRRNTQNPPQDVTFQARWDTDLTWHQGADYTEKLPQGLSPYALTIHLEGATHDSVIGPAKAYDEISLDYEADSNALHGLYEQNDSVKKGENTPVWLGDLHNPYGELLTKRNAVRYVKEFGARIVEWDAWFNGNNDFAAWRYVSPLHPLADLYPGPPNPATEGKIIVQSSFPIGWGEDDGNYWLWGNRANSSPTRFCLQQSKTCGDNFTCSTANICEVGKTNK